MSKTGLTTRAMLALAVFFTVSGELWVLAIPFALALWVSLVSVEP
jgi:hypothetical protein